MLYVVFAFGTINQIALKKGESHFKGCFYNIFFISDTFLKIMNSPTIIHNKTIQINIRQIDFVMRLNEKRKIISSL